MSKYHEHGIGAEITGDGRTVWVNSVVDGGCIGRFNRDGGVDVHVPMTVQVETGHQCLECSRTPDWEVFVVAMEKHYGIKRDRLDPHRPKPA